MSIKVLIRRIKGKIFLELRDEEDKGATISKTKTLKSLRLQTTFLV